MIRLYCHAHRPSQGQRGSHVPEIRITPERPPTASPAPHRQGSRRAPRGKSSATGDRKERVDGRSRRGRGGRLGRHRGALERQAKAPRSSRLDRAGEAQLLQWAQLTPPAGQARGTLRALARELEARGIVSRIRYETVRCMLKNELTP